MTQPLDPESFNPSEPFDPFDALRLDDAALAPRDAFAADLRTRLLTEIQIQGDMTMPDTLTTTHTAATGAAATSAAATSATGATNSASAPAAGSVSAVPYLIVRHGVAALDFYRAGLGAVESMRYVDDAGAVGHAEFRIGATAFALADEYADLDLLGPESRGGATCTFQLHVPDVDAAYIRAVEHGASGVRQPEDQFHGNRTADVRDPFGHRWLFTAPVQAMSDAQADAAAAEQGLTISRADTATTTATTTTTAAETEATIVGEVINDVQIKHYEPGDLYYFTIPVADLAKAQAFFGAVLGWQFDDPQAGHASNIAAPPGGVRAVTEPAQPAQPAQTQLWFVVEDIHTAVATVRALGGSSDEPVLYDSGWAADCVDDQGTPFSLSVPAAKYSR